MKNLSLTFFLALGFLMMGCTNTKGNQEDKNLQVVNQTTEGENGQPAPIYLTYDSFIEKVWDFESNPQEWKYKGDIPCVVDFYADWCKPCKLVAPIMDELAVKYDGKVQIYKINVDKEKKLAAVFQVRSIPSILFAPKEGRPSMQAGALQKSQYEEIIDTQLLNKSVTQ